MKTILTIIIIIVAIIIIFEYILPALLSFIFFILQLVGWLLVGALGIALVMGAIWLGRQLIKYYQDYRQEQIINMENEINREVNRKLENLNEKHIQYFDLLEEQTEVQISNAITFQRGVVNKKNQYLESTKVWYEEIVEYIAHELNEINYIIQKYLIEQDQAIQEKNEEAQKVDVQLINILDELKYKHLFLLSDDFEEKYSPKEWLIWEENPILKKIYLKTSHSAVLPWGVNDNEELRYEHISKKINTYKIPKNIERQSSSILSGFLSDLYTVLSSHTKKIIMTFVGEDDAGLTTEVIKNLKEYNSNHVNKNPKNFIESRITEIEENFSESLRQMYESEEYLLGEGDNQDFYQMMEPYEILIFFFDQNTSNDDLKAVNRINKDSRFLPIIFYQEKYEERLKNLELFEKTTGKINDIGLYKSMRKVESLNE